MPVIGLKHPVVAKYGVTAGGEVEYKDGKVMAKAIKADIYPEMTYRELEDDEMVYSYLLTTGYLKALGKNEDGTYNLVIPNKEVRTVYEKYFSKYTKGLKKKYSLKICRSLFDGDGEKAVAFVKKIREHLTSEHIDIMPIADVIR